MLLVKPGFWKNAFIAQCKLFVSELMYLLVFICEIMFGIFRKELIPLNLSCLRKIQWIRFLVQIAIMIKP